MRLYFQPRAPRGPTSPPRECGAAMTLTLMTTGPCPQCSQAGGGRAVTRGAALASAETHSDRSGQKHLKFLSIFLYFSYSSSFLMFHDIFPRFGAELA